MDLRHRLGYRIHLSDRTRTCMQGAHCTAVTQYIHWSLWPWHGLEPSSVPLLRLPPLVTISHWVGKAKALRGGGSVAGDGGDRPCHCEVGRCDDNDDDRCERGAGTRSQARADRTGGIVLQLRRGVPLRQGRRMSGLRPEVQQMQTKGTPWSDLPAAKTVAKRNSQSSQTGAGKFCWGGWRNRWLRILTSIRRHQCRRAHSSSSRRRNRKHQ